MAPMESTGQRALKLKRTRISCTRGGGGGGAITCGVYISDTPIKVLQTGIEAKCYTRGIRIHERVVTMSQQRPKSETSKMMCIQTLTRTRATIGVTPKCSEPPPLRRSIPQPKLTLRTHVRLTRATISWPTCTTNIVQS